MSSESVGLIGVGLLGTALARRIIAAGMHVVGYDVESARGEMLSSAGGQVASSPKEIVDRCRRVIFSLPDSSVVTEVVQTLDRNWSTGTIVLDTTTGDPNDTAATGKRLSESGVHYLDSTVLGSSDHVLAGDVLVLVGGETVAYEACADILATFARKTYHVGPCGSGARMKLVVNLVLGLNRAVLAEGLSFAKGSGMDPAMALEIMQQGLAYSRVMDAKGPKMLADDFTPQARLAQHKKDVELILAVAERSGAAVPLSRVHRQLLEDAANKGYAAADKCAIIKAFEQDG